MRRGLTPRQAARRLLRAPKDEQRNAAFRKVIRQIPRGKVATYAQVAAAAGYPLYHRQVAQLLRSAPVGSLPWQRVVGAGGQIKLRYEAALEQRTRLEMEGVRFRGKRVDMAEHQHRFRGWEWE
jgi:methylated-DNA-protein-cysteine methyltransferase related protein